jgi:CarD family transcriptional regulator
MFKVGDTIVYSDGKIYKIVEETEKDYGRGPQQYFELKQNELYKDEKNTSVFAPKQKVQNESRTLMTKKEVIRLIDELPKIDPIWINDSKQRKLIFSEYANSRDPKLISKLIKSFYFRTEELKDTNKSLTITDKRLMEKLKYDLFIEISLALNIPFDDVVSYIDRRLEK